MGQVLHQTLWNYILTTLELSTSRATLPRPTSPTIVDKANFFL